MRQNTGIEDQVEHVSAMSLATAYIDGKWSHTDGYTLRCHRGTFYSWTGTHYEPLCRSDLEGMVLMWLHEEGEDATPKLASQVTTCIAARVRLSAQLDPPIWCDDSQPLDPCTWIAMSMAYWT